MMRTGRAAATARPVHLEPGLSWKRPRVGDAAGRL